MQVGWAGLVCVGVCCSVVGLSRLAGTALLYSLWFRWESVALIERSEALRQTAALQWGRLPTLGAAQQPVIWREKKPSHKAPLCVVMATAGRLGRPSHYAAHALRSLLEGLDQEELDMVFSVAVLRGPDPFPAVLSHFDVVIREPPSNETYAPRRIKLAHAVGLAACRGRCDVLLWLEDDVWASRGVVGAALRIARLAAEEAAARKLRTWLVVKLFYSDHWDGWSTDTTPRFVMSVVVAALLGTCCVLWCVGRPLRRLLVAAMLCMTMLFVTLWLCISMGRQNVFPPFVKGRLNGYREALAQALLYNNKDGALEELIALLETPQDYLEYDLVIDQWALKRQHEALSAVWWPCLFQHVGVRTSLDHHQGRELSHWITQYKRCSSWSPDG